MNAITILPSRMPIPPALAKEFDLQPTEWRVLVEQIFPAAKSVESVMMALAYCRKRNLDIFKKPVHIVPMWSSIKGAMVETVWPGIAEIRTTASRTGEYAGIDAVEFGPMIERSFTGTIGRGQREETVTKNVRFPEWASVVVYRIVHGQKCAYHAKVFWEETYASIGKSDVPNEMWGKRPRGQLDKCVEAAALRKAFPEELGNTYAAEEMEGRSLDGMTIEHEARPTPPQPPAPPSPPKPPAPPEDAATIEHETAPDETSTEEVADPETGEIIEAGGDEAAAEEPAQPEPEDTTDFLDRLDAALAAATDAASIEEAWTELDPLAHFEGQVNGELNQGIAQGMKRRHLKRVRG